MTYDFRENRQIRIFISSTFRDMMQERDYLITRIFPALRRYCEDRDISLFELDLRWGVTQEESENQMAFKICLNEVDNTKPFFIGLLGERYGWVPDEKTIEQMKPTNVFEEYEWLLTEMKKKKSITEVEMQEGAFLPGKDEEINAYFYFRSPKMNTLDEHREEKGSHGETMLSELKERIRNNSKYDTYEYESIEQLGHQVEEDFKALVDKLFPEQGHLSDFEKERLQQHVYLKSKTRAYIENPAWLSFLDNFLQSNESMAAITGESGMGKCALLANWIVKRINQNVFNEKVLYHFIGVSQSEGDYCKIIQRLMEEVRFIYNHPKKQKDTQTTSLLNNDYQNPADLIKELQDLLLSIPKDQKLIIALDSLDRLIDADNCKMLNWIPEVSSNIKIICSSMSNDKCIEALTRRTKTILNLTAPSLETRKNIIQKYFEKFSKKLAAQQINKIISDKKSENPLVLLAILDDLRVFGNFDIFDKQIEDRLSQESNEALFYLFLRNIESIFNDNGKKNTVKDILSVIALSRRGLTETEIVNISQVPKLYWSHLSNCMSAHLLTINGVVTFSGSIMLNAVKNRYLKDADAQQHYRNAISSYMETSEEVSFNRKCEELPFQLFVLKEWDKLYNFLLDHNKFSFVFDKDKFELGNYWRALRETDADRYTMEIYLEPIKTKNKDEEIELVNFYERICTCLAYNLNDWELAIKFGFKIEEQLKKLNIKDFNSLGFIGACYSGLGDYENAIKYYLKLVSLFDSYMEENKDDKTVVAVIKNNKIPLLNALGDCYKHLDKYKDALAYLYDALNLSIEMLGKDNPRTCFSYECIGELYEDIEDYEKAYNNYCYAYEIHIKIHGKEDINTEGTYFNFGSVLMKMGKFKEALDAFSKSLNIYIKYFGMNNPHVISIINSLGMCFASLEDFKQALECYNNALNINLKIFGTDCKATAFSCSNIASTYYSLGEFENSFKYYNQALIIKKKILGEEHAEIGVLYLDFGKCYEAVQDYQNAYNCYEKALSITEKYFGKNHAITAMCFNKVGSFLCSLGQYKDAKNYLKDALLIYESLEGYEEEAANIREVIEEISRNT